VIGKPDISVVLPTYNRQASVARAINSVLAQRAEEAGGTASGLEPERFELIVVDDASQDGTADYLATLADPHIRVIRNARNGGPSAARNVGLAAAQAEIVAFLDSDDVYMAGRLAVPLDAFATDPALVCTLSSAVKRDPKGLREAHIPAVRLAPEAFAWALICDLIPVEASSITVRRKAALAVGGFCEKLRLTEDREFLIRLAAVGAARLLPPLLWAKSWGEDSLSNDWAAAGRGLANFVRERPEFAGRYRKIGVYLATKVLVADLRLGLWRTFLQDIAILRDAGLLDGNIVRLIRDHREVRRYRRTMSGEAALANLSGPPAAWR
jgi:glycosyltransferase involved in cell wall biosynthesis